jgi:hypothetical protein
MVDKRESLRTASSHVLLAWMSGLGRCRERGGEHVLVLAQEDR